MTDRTGPHIPKLLKLLAGRIQDLRLSPSELDDLWVGDSDDPVRDLWDALINLAGDIAADDATYDEED